MLRALRLRASAPSFVGASSRAPFERRDASIRVRTRGNFFERRTLATVVTVAALASFATGARAADPTDADLINPPLAQVAAPPPLNTPYLQYGVSFTAEFVANAGAMCPDSGDCILGSGGGLAMRLGRRSAGPWYFGAAYELSKQDPNRLYRLAVLQQLRFEARYYLTTGKDTQPYGAFGAGVAGYGNEWGVDTFGPNLFAAIGIETQLSRRTVVGIALAYRALYLTAFADPISGTRRPASFAQLIGIDVSLEGRDPL